MLRGTLFLVFGVCIFCIGNIRASKWVTDKDSIIVDANFEDDEEGELHFDDLDETETSRPECMTVDQEPGVCVTLRRCHPILFGANGELRHASLAEEFSQNVDSCVNTVEDNKPMPAMDQEDDDIVRSIPAEIGKASAAIAGRIVCCSKEKVPHVARLHDSSEQTTIFPPTVVPFGNEDVEKVTEVEKLFETVVDVETTGKPVQFQQEGQVVEEVHVTESPTTPQSSSPPPESSTSPTSPPPVSSTSPDPEEPQAEPIPEEEPQPEEAVQVVAEEPNVSNDISDSCSADNASPSFESYPFLAAIQTRATTGPLCSGSLIDSRHILTAAHCLHRFGSKDVARMQVRIGFTRNPHNNTFNDYHEERKASKIIFHKRFHEQSKMEHNIALVQLTEAVEFDKHVAPIRIFNDLRGFDVGTCSGVEPGWIKYGNRKVTGISDGVIHYVDPPMSDFVLKEAIRRIYRNEDCRLQLFTDITEEMLCAKTNVVEAHSDFRGNDGGPLVVKVGENYQQVGIKSWAYEGNQYPTVFTRVDRYLSWIKDNLQM